MPERRLNVTAGALLGRAAVAADVGGGETSRASSRASTDTEYGPAAGDVGGEQGGSYASALDELG